jgi:hypothetical protein
MITGPSKQKKLSQKIIQKKSGLGSKNRPESGKPKTDLLKTNRRSVFGFLKTDKFWFRSRIPAGIYYIAPRKIFPCATRTIL